VGSGRTLLIASSKDRSDRSKALFAPEECRIGSCGPSPPRKAGLEVIDLSECRRKEGTERIRLSLFVGQGSETDSESAHTRMPMTP
jgi:hypothetical protein